MQDKNNDIENVTEIGITKLNKQALKNEYN